MSLVQKLGLIAMTAAMLTGCRTQETHQVQTLTERISAREESPRPTKYTAITGNAIEPSSNLPTFKFTNYAQQHPEESKKYRTAFDVHPIDAEDFSAPLRTGETINFKEFAQYREYIIIEFTGADCFPCERLLPHLERFYATNKEKVELLSIVSGGEMEWNQYRAEHDVSHLLAFDSECNILGRYGFGTIPAMVLTQKGKVISVCKGFNKESIKWLSAIEKSIK